jgi:hypothetical protein
MRARLVRLGRHSLRARETFLERIQDNTGRNPLHLVDRHADTGERCACTAEQSAHREFFRALCLREIEAELVGLVGFLTIKERLDLSPVPQPLFQSFCGSDPVTPPVRTQDPQVPDHPDPLTPPAICTVIGLVGRELGTTVFWTACISWERSWKPVLGVRRTHQWIGYRIPILSAKETGSRRTRSTPHTTLGLLVNSHHYRLEAGGHCTAIRSCVWGLMAFPVGRLRQCKGTPQRPEERAHDGLRETLITSAKPDQPDHHIRTAHGFA